MYTLLVCADLFGEKCNLEITFPAMPTIGELQRKITEVYTNEAAIKRPPGYPNIDFAIARLQVYDDVLLKWTDLVTCTQLHEYDQLYAFQPQSPWHIDVQKDLPPPRPPTNQHNASRAPPVAPPTPAMSDASPYGYTAGSRGVPPPAASPVYASQQNSYAAPDNSYAATQRSPASHARLEETRRREEQLRAELARVHEEAMRLEAQEAAAAEEERRRQAEEKNRTLRQREMEVARQRELLRQMEEQLRAEQQVTSSDRR